LAKQNFIRVELMPNLKSRSIATISFAPIRRLPPWHFGRAGIATTCLIGLAGLGAPAFATEINVDNVTVPYYELVDITGEVDETMVSDQDQIAGEILLTVNNVGSTKQYTLPVWCVDIFHDIYLGGSGYLYTEGPLSTDNSDNPSKLTTTQIQEIEDLVSYGTAQMQSHPGDAISAEVQAAIWTVEYNNSAIGNTLTVVGGDVTPATINNVITAAEADGGGAGQLDSLDGAQGEAFSAPAPAIGHGFPVALALGGVLFGRKLLESLNLRAA
jgi:hypothetical protein